MPILNKTFLGRTTILNKAFLVTGDR
jgi:hypothetical protein